MAASERLRVAALGALVVLGCTAAPEPLPPADAIAAETPEPPPPPAASLPRPEDEQLAAAAAEVERAAEARREPTLIVIDAAGAEAAPPSLAEAAARERERRQREAGPVVKVTNQNLSELAEGGVLTIAHDTPEAATAESAEETLAAAAASEEYWRQRGLAIRQRWRAAADRVPELETQVAELRQRFYSADDPAYRDGEIKPQWDKALADLEEARYAVTQGAEEVAAFLEEGRRAGALPGWLREGAELEPEPVVEEVGEPGTLEPTEPSIYEPPPGR